jgi:4'-phosphopantetheinyl transferase
MQHPWAGERVQLWWADTTSALPWPHPWSEPALLADVDEATAARAAGLVRPDDRRRTLVAHALLRRVVGPLQGVQAREVVVHRRCDRCGSSDHGRPYLGAGPDHAALPDVSIAHSGALAVVAVTESGLRVGVDVEPLRLDPGWRDAYRSVMSASERDLADAADDGDAALVMAWTGKEAVVKATGRGLADDVTGLDVLGAPQSPDGWSAVGTAARVIFARLAAAGPSAREPYLAAVALLDPATGSRGGGRPVSFATTAPHGPATSSAGSSFPRGVTW